jgi:hypothetical protein
MSKKVNFVVVLFVLVLFLFVGLYIGKGSASSLDPDAYAVCALSMDEIIESGLGDVYDFSGVTDFEEPKFHYVAEYSVNGDSLASPVLQPVPADLGDEQKDYGLQNEAWQIFTELIPAQDRQMVAQFNVFTDGYSNTLAAVDQSKQNLSEWVLEVDIADLEDKDALVFTMIHEYAHLLTLNSTQVIPDADTFKDPYNLDLLKKKAAACSTYFAGTGCSLPDSYINAFYNRFWTDIQEEWTQIDELQYGTDDLVPYYNGLYTFYLEHKDQFVGDYAVTHPAEDIAESFTHFVFSPKPVGYSIRDQKLAFFYEYPELVQLREDILKGTCSLEQ